MKLNENIAKLRKARGLTQEQLANLLNVSVTAVSKWETGSNRPDLELLPDLAEVFQVSIDALIGYEKSYKSLEQALINATSLINRSEYEDARNLLETLLKRYPNDFHINYLLAESYYSLCFSAVSGRKRNIERAIFFYERSIELYEENAAPDLSVETLEIMIATLYALEETGACDKAIEIIRRYNDNGKYDNFLAQCLYTSGNHEEAKAIILEHCVGKQVFVFNDFSALADMFERDGDHATAIRFLEAKVKNFEVFMTEEGNYADRAYAGDAMIISRLYQKIGDFQKAEEWQKKAVFHAKRYSQNPSLQIADLRYCKNVKGRMIDSLEETIDWLAKQ